ncbi:hypothetical protein AAZX31_20G202100 [Glycine max]|uniref:DUF789 family protein n=2 Tax=Glycine subgen. Soja TaxID=1462606 RepID=K7N4X2_SOYBN|nr:uncharacterized protein LOC100796554 [Glycine max]XP_006606413.1 uncharacterized protein LOC100796554 [Glycine max]XP_025983089.1 uncharacterized protein LOC100796554 [Glycine max]XP_028221389.1 uncharacterized protein LOC114402902 [Glycine soja]XP_028221390.1 uncharacterized protein LOC114402902 [Glycine soja]KAG4911083.1 hypothetical protein JHK87_057199 [Glycine soja]KAH1191881.1 hypothetical protein GmHk_20G059029 [Glycine max]KHN05009.1 hypothetical protein glysoja_013916 [Glycine so|eukprot:XP_006606412.1 uncharacterized protein LOC100796554 [Glycine max]
MSSLSNLERFLLRVTPDVPSLTLQSCCSDLNAQWLPPGKDTIEYFTLKDLWDCYYEWSAFGAGIPMILENGDTLVQYYAPYLSATQIYISKSRIRKEYGEGVEVECDSLSEDSASDNLSRSPSNNSSKAWDDASLDSGSDQVGSCTTKDMLGALYLQYSENSPPYQRVPFSEKITELAKSHPGLMRLKSVDISPTSWMAVSWYPIYSVPCHKNKRDQTSFLTFHSLSSFQDCASKYDEIHTGNNKSCLIDWRSIVGEKCKKKERGCMSLSPFGLATYKMRKNIWLNPYNNNQVVTDLYNAADWWLKHINADHPDFNFFTRQPTL